MSSYLQIFKSLMKADACDYGDGITTVRKSSKRSGAAAEEAEAADVSTPGQTPGQAMENRTPLDATTANGHDRFEHIGNEDSAAGTVILVLIIFCHHMAGLYHPLHTDYFANISI